MASPTDSNPRLRDDKGREKRLANLSGALAVARLSHQVKELELQKDKQLQVEKPIFKPLNCIIDAGVLLSMLDAVKRWSTEGGVNVLVPLTVLDELDKLKRGAEPINAKARLTIRFLDGKTKARSRPARNTDVDSPSGTFRVQTSEELFKTWEECEDLANESGVESIEKNDIPRHLRGMVNCVLFQRSQGNEYVIATDDSDLITFVERWGITTMSGKEVDTKSAQGLERFRNEMKVYENRGRNAARHSPPQGRALWTPPKR